MTRLRNAKTERLADGQMHVYSRIDRIEKPFGLWRIWGAFAHLSCGHSAPYKPRFLHKKPPQKTMICPYCTADLRARGGAA